ncbi:MAG: methylmalonyl Co-A mutase-associated GTPase MeaB [Burkholderiales bacterium]|nr:methylmalonyl Co-A mutase-associated GTPase MeaB [Burkholderiales bacterium]
MTLPTADQALVDAVLGSPGPAQRRAMAKAITLLESTRSDHRDRADALLTELLAHTGASFRLGISGVPGVGKSTFIEVLGLYLIERGHRVAVLAVDPSSSVSGGSILGDKTRMERLSVNERAYIRPSPSSGTLGGVAEKTRESMLVCEAAGYDVVIVETVGVGQSETAVAGMTDMYTLLQLPNAGDDLQAIKKGVMELADLVVINKADIDANAATRAQAQIASSLRLLGMHHRADHVAHDQTQWHAEVMQLSAIESMKGRSRVDSTPSGGGGGDQPSPRGAMHADGIDRFWNAVTRFRDLQASGGRFAQRRSQQSLNWMWDHIHAELRHRFSHHPAVQQVLAETSRHVAAGLVPASAAARSLLARFATAA